MFNAKSASEIGHVNEPLNTAVSITKGYVPNLFPIPVL